MPQAVPDQWIADGCRMARLLLAQGLVNQAAEVLRYVEIRGLGLTPADRARTAKRRGYHATCSARGCTEIRGRHKDRRICRYHMPRFDRDPEEAA